MKSIPVTPDADPPSGSAAWLRIGDLARRSGIAASALRYYEELGLIQGGRSAGGHRQYPRHVLRRLAFIRAAQTLGLSLPQVAEVLRGLPDRRTPTKEDWSRLASAWAPLIDARIAALQRLRDRLDACIGCGCLSMRACALYNPDDEAGQCGAGPQYLLQATVPRRRRG